MNVLRAIISNTSSQVASRIISSGTGFFITLLIAHFYSLSGYSDLAKITALVGLLYLGIDLGANAIFLQFDKKQQSFQNLLSFRLFLAALIFFTTAAIVFLLPYNSAATTGYSPLVKFGILLFSLSFFTRAIVYSCAAFFQQKLSYTNAMWATLASSATTFLIVLLSVFFHLPLLWVVGAYLLGGLMEAGVSLFLLKEKFSLTLPSLSFFAKIFWSTLPLTILLFLNLLYFRVDMILLALFQKSFAVGIYDFAYKFFDFLIALPLFLSNSLYPILLKQEKNSRISIKNISLYTIFFFFMGACLVPIVWFMAPLIALVKIDFVPSILPLRILAFSLPIFFATNILQWIFITKKKQTFLVFVYAASLLLNIVLNFLFIPSYSYIASAIITGFSETLILVIMISYLFIKPL